MGILWHAGPLHALVLARSTRAKTSTKLDLEYEGRQLRIIATESSEETLE